MLLQRTQIGLTNRRALEARSSATPTMCAAKKRLSERFGGSASREAGPNRAGIVGDPRSHPLSGVGSQAIHVAGGARRPLQDYAQASAVEQAASHLARFGQGRVLACPSLCAVRCTSSGRRRTGAPIPGRHSGGSSLVLPPTSSTVCRKVEVQVTVRSSGVASW